MNKDIKLKNQLLSGLDFTQMKIFFSVLTFILLCSIKDLSAQGTLIVSGTVKEKGTNVGLPGVSITLKGPPDRALSSTRADGSFTVSVPVNARLKFTIVGFEPREVIAAKTLNIVLNPDVSTLNDLVIRGFVTKTRDLSSGSSVKISGDDLQQVPVANAEQLLQGKVAGLNIQVNTGAPGFRGSVLLRGLSNVDVSASTTGNDADAFLSPTSPLYVIDGVPTDVDPATADSFNSFGGASPLSLIPQEDIANIEVLKDAQATSLYGSRGAYGVILITTRRGMSAIPRLRYTTNFFISTPPKLRATIGGKAERDLKLQQIYQYGSFKDINSLLNSTAALVDSLNPYYSNSTNWQDIYYGTTYNQTHNIGVEGGDKSFNYKTNFGYYKETGIQVNTGVTRFTLSNNFEYKPNSKISLFALINGSIMDRKKGNGVGLLNTGIARSAAASSLLPGPSLFLASNDALANLNVDNSNPTKNLKTNLEFTYYPIPGLTLRTTGSYDILNAVDYTFTPAIANTQQAAIQYFNDTRKTLYNRNLISFSKSLKGGHDFTIFGFNEVYFKKYQANDLKQVGLSSDHYLGPFGFISAASSTRGAGLRAYSNLRAVSFAGSFSYNFRRKYVFDASYRMDATSFSGVDDPYTRSPSIGLRWNMEREAIFSEWKWLTNSSLRLTWGKNITPTGNIFTVYGTYNPNGTYNGQSRITIDQALLPNKNLGSAVGTTYNLGYDLGLFNNKIQLTFESYYRAIDRQARTLTLPNIIGFDNVLSNEVSIRNWGNEISLTLRPLPLNSKVNWSFTINGAMNRDMLTRLPGGVQQIVIGGTVLHVGRNSLSNFIYENKGVYSNQSDVPVNPVTGLPLRQGSSGGGYYQAGDPIFVDRNGDYVISDLDDRTVIGNTQPIYTGGFATTVSYKSFSLSLNGSFTIDRDIMNTAIAERLVMTGNPFGTQAVLPLSGLDIWTKPGDIAKYPNPYNYTRAALVAPFRTNQSLFQEDGSYFKINAVTLGYTIPKELANKLRLNNLRVYLTGDNLATFSRYSGPNPENVTALGFDNSGGYPLARRYTIGLNLEL
ncbi:SusC/RagA family TonB-linked outer membrane protein [Pedobacter sp. SG908]|uniref:SusC/RagA family TonB-linked outer membrane protein n=1 Tax=Pedobacter sp. SG908 TaxID=2587135 RepID=UPI001423105A|nr:SusC/RagA family TonB-linked outer membrane protein [Pedobacter sp. SG908]NII83698.1 TonB-linked SusC/RagA family outer membrane protein [Pedobacter sp. SG908]